MAEPQRLSRRAVRVIHDEANQLPLSAASLWEIALKAQAGKLRLPEEAGFLPHRGQPTAEELPHAALLSERSEYRFDFLIDPRRQQPVLLRCAANVLASYCLKRHPSLFGCPAPATSHAHSVGAARVLELVRLPAHHRDPFDRLLMARCQVEKLVILTADAAIRRYAVRTIW